MSAIPLSIIIVLVLWILGFIFMESKNILTGMVSIACYLFPILIFTSPLEYVIESNGILSQSTLALSTTTQSQLVLVDVFFLFMALINEWYLVRSSREPGKPLED